jgi:hypothetical protein
LIRGQPVLSSGRQTRLSEMEKEYWIHGDGLSRLALACCKLLWGQSLFGKSTNSNMGIYLGVNTESIELPMHADLTQQRGASDNRNVT